MATNTNRARWWDFHQRRNQHHFEAFFESNSDCWCTKGRSHRIHRGTRRLADTPLAARLGLRVRNGTDEEPRTAAPGEAAAVAVAAPTRLS